MLGLRTDEGEKFERYFRRVQHEAQKRGKVFFLDFGDGWDREIGDMIVDDMFGWLIPKDEAGAFNRAFLAWENLERWDDYVTWVLVDKNTLKISFKQYH